MFKNNSPERSRFLLEVIGLGYVAYLIYGMIGDYTSGEAGVSLPVFIATVGGLSLGCIVLGILAFRNWKKLKAKENETEEQSEEEVSSDSE